MFPVHAKHLSHSSSTPETDSPQLASDQSGTKEFVARGREINYPRRNVFPCGREFGGEIFSGAEPILLFIAPRWAIVVSLCDVQDMYVVPVYRSRL